MATSSRVDDERGRQRRRGIVRAVTGPLNLAVVGASGLGALALGSWPIVALGGAAYAALVALDLTSPKFWAKVVRGGPALDPVALPTPKSLEAPELQRLAAGILQARAELTRVVETTPAAVLSHLGDTFATAAELERRAAVLLGRADVLARYLARAGLPDVRRSVAELRATCAAASDPEARAQYQQALATREDHLRTLEEILSADQRLVAHLNRMAALLAALPAKVVHLRALDAEAMDRVSGDMKQELDLFNVEISSFEETLKTLSEVGDT